MTKEEAYSRLKENLDIIEFEYPGIGEAVKVALDVLSQPSLPSNLDEAAEEYVKDYGYTEDDYKRERIIAEEHFKAGTEWVAGQGETHELTVESPVLCPPMICCPVKGFSNGDEVIVQIRKK